MLKRTPTSQRRRGVAAVELALVAPVLLILLLGLWEVGRLIEVQQVLSNAVREGARQASTAVGRSPAVTSDTVKATVVFYCTQNGLSSVTASNVTVQNLTHPGTDPSQASQLDQIQVSISIPFNSVKWVLLNQTITNITNLSATSTFYSMADIPLTVNTTIPLY